MIELPRFAPRDTNASSNSYPERIGPLLALFSTFLTLLYASALHATSLERCVSMTLRHQPDEFTVAAVLSYSLRGIGPYAASHLAMLLHDYSRIPVDSEVRRFCRERYDIGADQIAAFFDSWGAYRFLGYKVGRILTRDEVRA